MLLLVFFFTISLIITTIAAQNSDYTKLCRLFKTNTKIRVPGTCHQYIVCNGNSGEIFSCANNLKYDAKQQKCVQDFTDSKRICENRCANAKTGTWVADPTNCQSFYYCANGKAFASRCQSQYYFDEAKAMCVYPSFSSCKHISYICELVADNTQFRNENDCAQYYKCTKNKQTSATCPKSGYFNVETQSCTERKNVQCNAHPINNVCLVSGKPYVGLKSDSGTCRGYFICAYMGDYAHDLQPVWMLCPAGTLFSEEEQRCMKPIDVKCLHNRCDGRPNMLVSSSLNNCRNFITCKNGKEVKEEVCQNNYFFDELLQVCVPKPIYYKCCDQPKTHSEINFY